MHNTHFRYGVLILIGLFWISPVRGDVVLYAGLSAGQATTTHNDQFDATESMHLFFGLQTEYYFTLETGLTLLYTDNPTSANENRRYLALLSGTALGHLPIGDSSLFIRAGISGYQYRDNSESLQDIFLPTYGAGIDLGVVPRITIRLEWQRYVGLKMNNAKFDVETMHLGAFYYF